MSYVQQFTIRAIALMVMLAVSMPLASAQQDLNLQVGLSQRIELPDAVANVVVGAPSIVDILPLSTNVYILHPQAVGTTNIIAVNENAEQIFYSRIHVRPADLTPRFRVCVTPGSGAVNCRVCDHERGCPLGGSSGAPISELEPDEQEAVEPDLPPAEG